MADHEHTHRPSHDPRVTWLRIAVGAIAVATAIALAVLWPRGDQSITTGPSGVLPTVRGEVIVAGQPCAFIPSNPCQRLTVQLENGPDGGTTTSFDVSDSLRFEVGDRLRLTPSGLPDPTLPPDATQPDTYAFTDFERRTPMLLLAAVFVVAILVSTRVHGARALVALGVSLMLVVAFIVPAILDGRDPLLIALVGAMAIAIATITLTYGLGVKAMAAIVGTVSALMLTLVLANMATSFTRLTGRASEEILFLQAMNDPGRIPIVGLMIAGAVIGALGVLDDLTVSQASTVLALRRANPALGARSLFRGALSVGHDHILATVNTLILAYAGAALPTLLIFSASDTGFWDAFNSEVVAGDVVSMLVGSLGLMAAVPVTTAVAAALAVRMDVDALEDEGHTHAH